MKVRNFSPRTRQIYLDRVAKFAKHFSQSPERLGPEEIRSYQLYWIHNKHDSWPRLA